MPGRRDRETFLKQTALRSGSIKQNEARWCGRESGSHGFTGIGNADERTNEISPRAFHLREGPSTSNRVSWRSARAVNGRKRRLVSVRVYGRKNEKKTKNTNKTKTFPMTTRARGRHGSINRRRRSNRPCRALAISREHGTRKYEVRIIDRVVVLSGRKTNRHDRRKTEMKLHRVDHEPRGFAGSVTFFCYGG